MFHQPRRLRLHAASRDRHRSGGQEAALLLALSEFELTWLSGIHLPGGLLTRALRDRFGDAFTTSLVERTQGPTREVRQELRPSAALSRLLTSELDPNSGEPIQVRTLEMNLQAQPIVRARALVFLSRVTADEARRLQASEQSLGEVLAACGIHRHLLEATPCIASFGEAGEDDPLLVITAGLARDGQQLAYVEETFLHRISSAPARRMSA